MNFNWSPLPNAKNGDVGNVAIAGCVQPDDVTIGVVTPLRRSSSVKTPKLWVWLENHYQRGEVGTVQPPATVCSAPSDGMLMATFTPRYVEVLV